MNGDDVTPARPKQRALLAFLILRSDHVVASDDLIAALWGDAPPATAQTALHGHVSALRKLLGSKAIETLTPGYRLRTLPEQIDARRFQAMLQQARREADPARRAGLLSEGLSLFRGEPLSDFRYASFALEDIRRLEELRLSAVEERIDADLELGRHAELIPELEGVVAANPLRERLRGQLMLALYRAGRQADALDAFRSARRVLAEELGLEPGPPLRDLERKILDHDRSLAGPAARSAPTPRLVRRPVRVAAGGAVALAVALAALAAVIFGSGDSAGRISGDAVALIDPATADVKGSVPLDSRPGDVAAGGGDVWVTLPDRGAVVRIDPERMTVVDTVPVGADPSGIAVGAGSVWVANSGGSTVSRISPARSSVVQTIDVPGSPAGIAAGRGAVWVANSADDSVSRIDPTSGRVTTTIGVGDQPVGLATDGEDLWVANESSGTVSRVGGRRDATVETVDVGGAPEAIAAGPGGIWVADLLDGTVSRIDPDTDAVVQTILVEGAPGGVATGGGLVWASDESGGAVTRIEPGRGATATIPLGRHTGRIAMGGAALWVSVRGAETAHRGGTLTVVAPDALDSIDPALAYFSPSWSILELTNDGLVGFRRVGGRAGATLVPDLARSIPQPTNGARTYTFRLRPGVRYSNGAPVRARDFRTAIERVFSLDSAGALHYRALAGAEACRPGSCDLSAGIVTDDQGGTVTFRLEQPDPDFLHRLALPFASAVPADLPNRALGSRAVPATGPYLIERYTKGRKVVLSRNPAFREWSSAAQPDGFPDRIVWRLGIPEHRQVSEVLKGRADLTFFPPPRGLLRRLAASHAGQVHFTPQPAIYHMALNTTVPPFDDLRVRRALNFAVDRGRVAGLFAGAGRPTCQFLPPNFPGYVPYCPYTRQPGPTWNSPDLTTARKLVKRSRTGGRRVTVWATPDYAFGIPVPVARYFVELLEELGYRARLKLVAGQTEYFSAIVDPSRRVQIAFEGWTSDYPTESGFVVPMLSCDALGNSAARFCDPTMERRIDRATSMQLSEPTAAHRRWASVEHELVDLAPLVFLVSRVRVNLVSERAGNLQVHPQWGPLLDQMWVR